jgi:3-dehydroquinate dehydratase-2
MTRRIDVLNGPNLNRLGTREPELYGRVTLAEIEAHCRAAAPGTEIVFRQSNAESQLVDWIHEAIDAKADGLIVNPAGLSFTSVTLVDALAMFDGPVFELHITNIHARDELHRHSIVSATATAVIAGLGPDGYRVAVEAMSRRLGG